jgi:glyoxylase-like metal-dependent hydrolase (beta-lactamase superfamily II)
MCAENIDLGYDGRRGVLGAWLAHGVLIDCGPSSCLQALLDGLGGRRPRALLLTHVHLDHAGAAGALTARWPQLPVYVHPVGAPHLIDPSRLVASARRVFGEALEPLLGEVQAVPGANVRVLTDGQQVEGFIAAWTPGHASHHVVFLDPREGLAYAGDVAGVRLAGGAVLPPTPPPDIDLRLWEGSLELLERWRPRALALAHFGRVESPQEHITLLREALARHERWAAAGVEEFAAALHQHLCARVAPAEVEDYEFIAMARQSPLGLRRWLEREQAAAGAARGG